MSRERLLLRRRELGLPIIALLDELFLASQLVGRDEVAGASRAVCDEPGEDVGRVVELDQLADRVEHLLLVVPLVIRRILVGEAGRPGLVHRMEEQVVLLVVDELDRTDLAKALLVRVEETTQLLGGLVQEIAALELGVGGQLAQRDDAR